MTTSIPMTTASHELLARDGQLKENWYVACQSSALSADKPLKRVIYDLPMVLFRDEQGAAVCLPDRCLHRHSPLSAGKVECGKIVCPYHGWRYNSKGELDYIPSEKNVVQQAGKRVLKPMPVIEQDGFIWVYMGDTAPSPDKKPWRMPYKQEEGWRHYVMETEFSNEVLHLVENFMDVPHTVFVHAGWFRNAKEKEVEIEVETKDGEVLVTYHLPADQIGFIDKLLNPKGLPLLHTDCFIMPNITRVDYIFGGVKGFSIDSQCTPVSTLKTFVYTAIIYKINAFDRFLRPFLNWYTRVVITQDVRIMQLQGDNFRYRHQPSFLSGRADIVHHEIEKLRRSGSQSERQFQSIFGRKTARIWI